MWIDGKSAIKICREEASPPLTQVQLAAQVPCSPESIGAYERGETPPSEEVILRIAEICGTPWLNLCYLAHYSLIFRALFGEFDGYGENIQSDAITLINRTKKADGIEMEVAAILEDGRVSEDEAQSLRLVIDKAKGLARGLARILCSGSEFMAKRKSPLHKMQKT